MTPPDLHGIHVPLVTPFTGADDVALDALEGLAHQVLDGGAAGIVALGTTAETAALDPGERAAVVEVCARVCRERGAVLIVGAGTHDTRRSLAALGALAGRPEVAAALVPVPYYVRPGPAGVVEHFRRLAEAAPVPLIAYHVPYRSGQSLDAAAVRALARVPGVVGVKYATGVIDQDTVDLMTDRPAGFTVLAGDDVLLAPMLALGAAGGILATAHVATSAFVRLAGNRPGAGTRLPAALARLAAAVFAEPNPTVVKAVLHARGRIPTPAVRLPLLPAGPDSTRTALDRLADPDLAPR